jgi:hypothetical protein
MKRIGLLIIGMLFAVSLVGAADCATAGKMQCGGKDRTAACVCCPNDAAACCTAAKCTCADCDKCCVSNAVNAARTQCATCACKADAGTACTCDTCSEGACKDTCSCPNSK